MPATFPLWVIDRLRMATDGTGVTTLVCAHGCPLHCRYCINDRCTLSESKAGDVTPEELFALVKKDALYFSATGGGVCFGGGEPLLWAPFIKDFSALIPSSWNLYAETSLNVPTENVLMLADCISTFIVDIKDANPEIYRKYTGCDNALVFKNLEKLLLAAGAEHIVVRVPHIPDFNTEEDVQHTLETLKKLGCTRFDVFNYKIPQRRK